MTKSGFGLAPIKEEGKHFFLDPDYQNPYTKDDPSTYMELCLKKRWSRKEIHEEVDKWLDEEPWWKDKHD